VASFPFAPCLVIRLEDRLQPNIGFTVRGDLVVFTRSAILMTSEALKVHCWGMALTDFGRDLHSSDNLRGRRNGARHSHYGRLPHFLHFALRFVSLYLWREILKYGKQIYRSKSVDANYP